MKSARSLFRLTLLGCNAFNGIIALEGCCTRSEVRVRVTPTDFTHLSLSLLKAAAFMASKLGEVHKLTPEAGLWWTRVFYLFINFFLSNIIYIRIL